MFRRMLTAGLAPTALLAALAWTAAAAAKPPDLPLVDRDTLGSQTPFVPADAPHPAHPNPFPIGAETDAVPVLEMPSLLHLRPSTRRMIASCLLFGAHPLLALAPTEAYFDFDEDEAQTVTPAAFLAPVTSEAPTGSLLIGAGVDTDAGLTGSIELNAPMAWGEIITACRRIFPHGSSESAAPDAKEERATGFHLGQTEDCEDEAPALVPPKRIQQAPKELVPPGPEQSACPWMRQLQCAPDRSGVLFTEADLFPDVLQNLTMLHQAQTLLQKARELGGEGRVLEALDCLDLAHDLCPGNRFDAALQEAALELFTPCYCGSPQGAAGGGGEVLSEPPAEKSQEKKPADETKPFNASRSTGREREIEMKLAQPATVLFKDEPLHQVIDDLRSWQNINICVDKAALDAEEISLDHPISIRIENVSLKNTLHLILKEARLTYVVKNGVLQITTERAARGKLMRVSYGVADILSDAAPMPGSQTGTGKQTMSASLIKLVTSTVCPHTWSDAGGLGTIDFHPLSYVLIVNQTADVQEQIADLLEALRRMQRPEADACEEAASLKSDASFTPCLPPVDPGTPAALDQLLHESFHSDLIGVGADQEQEQPVETPPGTAKPFQKADDLGAIGCGKDAGSSLSRLDVFSHFSLVSHPVLAEFGFGRDGSFRMFTQLRQGGAVWHLHYKSGGLSVWASPDGGADVETSADDKPSD